MKKILITILLSLILLSGCVAETSSDTLVIGTSSGYPPYEIIEPDGTLSGFDIEFGNLLAKELGYENVTWEDGSFDGLIGKLQAGSIDLAIAGLSPDPEREAIFSDPYYMDGDNPLHILTTADSGIKVSEDIEGKVAGAQLGTIQESALKTIKDAYNLTIDARSDYGTIVQEVLLGRINFLMVEPAVAQEFKANYDELISFEFVSESIAPLNGVSVAMPLDSDLLEKVNSVIEKLTKDGTLDSLANKYF
ncbi:MAG: amino acid ABC transporter substrate-binding protein [Erysipelothrix sp.]|nr:amino acid ABC transporter substrate-binding protein [Erysipelothrix sp.]